MKAVLPEDEREEALRKADSLEKMSVEISTGESVSMVYKADGEFYIWGPASVEIVDKENDKIRVEALDKALPQLLKRARLSYAHTDQIVGRILDGFKTKEEVEVQIGDETFKRQEFPTDVLELEGADNPALYVGGEVYKDTEQAQEVRKKIEAGEIDSYSISGEALVTRKQVENDQVYDDILELDLSAVTLCEEGMNQGAKFARVNGEVDEVELADPESEVSDQTEKSFELTDGEVSSLDRENNTQTENMSKSDDSPEDDAIGDDLPDSVATKADVEKQIDKQFEEKFMKRFDVHFARKAEDLTETLVEELDREVSKEITDQVSEAVSAAVDEALPNANLATKGYIDDVVEEVVEEKLSTESKGDDEDYEEEEEEESPAEEAVEDIEEEVDEAEEEMEDDKGENTYSAAELKEQLPSDMYEVVAEYIGKDEDPTDVAEGKEELDEQVEKILSGDGITTTPSPGAENGDEQYEQDIEKDDSGEEAASSPALQNFDHT